MPEQKTKSKSSEPKYLPKIISRAIKLDELKIAHEKKERINKAEKLKAKKKM